MTTQVSVDSHCINLGVGQPDPDLLPAELFTGLQVARDHLAYGREIGDDRFRESLAAWLSADYGRPVAPESLMVTNGSSNALDMICTHFARPGDTVLVEDPTYFLALKQFRDHGLETVAVPMDGEGVIPEALEQMIDSHQPAFLYTIPSFHNPAGVTQSDSRRRHLVSLCGDRNLPIAADEVYQSLYFDAAPPPPLACYDRNGLVLSVGSFSKILAPGLRLGWIQASPDLLEVLTGSALLLSGGGLNPAGSALVEPMISGGKLTAYLESLRSNYRARRDRLNAGLAHYCGDKLSWELPDGGFFIWTKRHNGKDAAPPLERADNPGVKYHPGGFFSASPDRRCYLRLCFAFYGEERLEEACRRLGELL